MSTKRKIVDPTASVVTVTPEMAKAWLSSSNKGNRKLRPQQVELYAHEMLAGRWKLNGESITFSETGRLVNGQHRLEGVVKANIPVRMQITTGVEESAFATLDTGLIRKASDILTFHGTPNAIRVASVLRTALNYRDSNAYSTKRSIPETSEATLQYPEVVEFVSNYREIFNYGGAPVASALYLAHTFGTPGTISKVEQFMDGVTSGVNLTSSDIRLMFRNKMIKQRSSKHRPESLATWDFVVRTLQHYVNGNQITKLSIGKGTPQFLEMNFLPKAVVKANW